MESDEDSNSQAAVEDAHLIRPWVDQFQVAFFSSLLKSSIIVFAALAAAANRYYSQAMSRRCQRNALLQLISTCGLQHVRHVRQLIEPHFQKDFLAHLPVEVNTSL